MKGHRLMRLVQAVGNGISNPIVIADIGADHGLLSGALIKNALTTKHLFISDMSVDALRGARNLFSSITETNPELSSAFTFLIGDGLRPLLSFSEPPPAVHTLVLAGMGTNTVLQILRNQVYHENKNENDNENEHKHENRKFKSSTALFDFSNEATRFEWQSSLDTLQVQRIIVQPWPPNILPLHALYNQIQTGDFRIQDQNIDYFNGYHHITTSFTRVSRQPHAHTQPSYKDFSHYKWPLIERFAASNKCMSHEENRYWLSYLKKQKATLQKKIKGMDNGIKSDNHDDYKSAASSILNYIQEIERG